MMSRANCAVCGRIIPDSLAYCPICAASLAVELRAVPGLVADLEIAAARLDKLGRERAGGKSAETPLPVALGADGNPADYTRRRRRLEETIGPAAWAVDKRHKLGLVNAVTSPGLAQLTHSNRNGASYRYDAAYVDLVPVHTIELVAVWLACHTGPFRTLPNAGTLHMQIVAAVAGARTVVDRLPDLVLKGLCTYTWTHDGELVECRTELRAERGAAYVRCPRCGSHYNVRDLERTALRTADGMLFTLGEIEKLMRELGEPVARSTLYLWAQHKRITPAGWRRPDGSTSDAWIHRNDLALYRLGEARALRRTDESEAAR